MPTVAHNTQTHDLLTPVLVALSTLQYHHRLTRDQFIKTQFESMKCVVVFGRAVFHAINGTRAFKTELVPLNNECPEFSDWRDSMRETMRNDELVEEFRRLRDLLLKEGTIDCMASMSNAPIIDRGKFIGASGEPEGVQVLGGIIGTQYGGMVWECIRSDGTVEYFPAKLPERTIFEYKIDKKEIHHLGVRYANPTLRHMCDLYLRWWESTVMKILKNYKKRD